MLDNIRVVFSQVVNNQCLESVTDTEFHIFDNDDPAQRRCFIQAETDGIKHFTVENPTARLIHFLAIDNCLFPHSEATQRCDCAVFDSKTFCFIEIKEVHLAARRSDALNKAREQLLTTIKLFQEQLEFTTKRIEAYACVGRTTARPARSATNLNELAEFAEVGAKLYYGTIKRFA